MRFRINSPSLVLSILFLLAVLPFSAVADEDSETLNLVPHWKSGERFRYELVLSGRKTQNGIITMDTTTTTPVVIEVLEANEDGYAVGWTLGETRFQDPKQAADPLLKSMCGLVRDFQTILEINGSATITGVRNWKESQANLDRVMKQIAVFLKETGVKESDIELVVKQVKPMYATKEGTETFSTREAQIFLTAIGVTYPLSGVREFQIMAANPFGGDPFPFRCEYRVKQIDKTRDLVVVTLKQAIDPVAGKEILEKTCKDMAQRMGKPVPEGALLEQLSMEVDAEFTVQLSTGWPLSIRHTKTIITPDMILIDTAIYTRSDE